MRNEYKYMISLPDSIVLKQILRANFRPDDNAFDGESYTVRSLYFDDADHTAYYEKEDGLEMREKFRIRMYNGDKSYVVLEKKIKKGDYSDKIQQRISPDIAEKLIRGDIYGIESDGESLIDEFLMKMRLKGLRPDCIIEYKRTAFVFPSQNTRVTFDEQLKTAESADFFNQNLPFILLPDEGEVILEVKFNKMFPPFFAVILGSIPSDRLAISKFKLCKDLFI